MQLYTDKKDIINWLEKYKISDYKLIEDSQYGHTVNVQGNVYLYGKNLKHLKVKFNEVKGSFHCENNKIVNLVGAPKTISGDFRAHNNCFTNLIGCPQTFGRLWVSGCSIGSLEGCPETLEGSLIVFDNQLKNLIGAPKTIKGFLSISQNPLTSLEGCPQEIYGSLECCHTPDLHELKLQHLPKLIGEYVSFENNPQLGAKIPSFISLEEIRAYLENQHLNSIVNKKLKEKIVQKI